MDTIVALATPPGKSALAMIRLSGPQAQPFFLRCVTSASSGAAPKARVIAAYSFVHPMNKTAIDFLTAIRYEGPQSYTGEDMVEIICHGGSAIIEAILSCFVLLGARLAGPGEFTRRAFTNGKISLLRAEAIAGLSDSISSGSLSSAMNQYHGQSEQVIVKIKNKLKEFLVLLESGIEFPEEEETQNSSVLKKVEFGLNETESIISLEIIKRELIRLNEKGLIVVIAGRPNVGKSTIFNGILDFSRSIVHEEKGTTRDYVSEEINLDGRKVTLIDTAGIYPSNNKLEILGIERSWETIKNADCIMWVSAADQSEVSDEETALIKGRQGKAVVAVINKADRCTGENLSEFCDSKNIPHCKISMLTSEGKMTVKKFLAKQLAAFFGTSQEISLIINARQEALIREALKEINQAKKLLHTHSQELLVRHIKNTLERIQEFSGAITSEQILDDIFSRFCIGK